MRAAAQPSSAPAPAEPAPTQPTPTDPAARALGDEERRRSLRVPAEGVPVTLRLAGMRFLGRVCDVSRGGLRIEVGCPPVVGTSVTVQHSLAGVLTGTCLRQTPEEIALAFDPAEREVERALQCLALLLDGDTPPARGL